MVETKPELKKPEPKKKKKSKSIDDTAEIEESIDDLIYQETYDKAIKKDYNSKDYEVMKENMEGGNETHNSGNFGGGS